MKKIMLLLACAIGSLNLLAQSEIPASKNWVKIFENDLVRIESKFGDCRIEQEGYEAEWVFIRIQNKAASAVNLQWNQQLYYAGKCYGCDGAEEYISRFRLNPGESKEGQCRLGSKDGLSLFSKWLNQQNTHALTKAVLTNIESKIIGHE